MTEVSSTVEALSSETVIVARGLAKWYGRITGLTDLNLELPRGITGLLGPNGAGKSTFMRLVTGLVRPSDGTLRVLGHDPMTEPGLFRRLGYCSEDDALYDDMTPKETVTYLAKCSGFGTSEARSRADAALERTGIADSKHRKCGGFSKGMRQRVRLAASIVHEPEILLLDEPMTGLDPIGRRDMVNFIREMAKSGCSVLFSSHILHEVETVSDHVVVLSKGMCLAEGSISHIRSCLTDYSFTLQVQCSDPRRLAKALADRAHVSGLSFSGNGTISISSDSSRALLTELPSLALELGLDVHEISCPGENLETLFQRLVR